MRYIERDPIIVSSKYASSLSTFEVSIRGTSHRDNIFFKHNDILALLNLPSRTYPRDTVWIDTNEGRFLYISYDSLVELYRIKSKHGCSSTSKGFRFMFLINTILDDDSGSELNDSEYSFSIDSNSSSSIYDTNGYLLELIQEYKNTIEALSALLYIKDGSIRRLEHENQQLRNTQYINTNRNIVTLPTSAPRCNEDDNNSLEEDDLSGSSDEESEWV